MVFPTLDSSRVPQCKDCTSWNANHQHNLCAEIEKACGMLGDVSSEAYRILNAALEYKTSLTEDHYDLLG